MLVIRILDTLAESAREGIAMMIKDGIEAGAPLPCDEQMMTDLATSAVENTIRTLRDRAMIAQHAGPGCEVVAMLLTVNYLETAFAALKQSFVDSFDAAGITAASLGIKQ